MADYKYDSPYSGSGSLTREQFLFHETRIVAKLLIDEGLISECSRKDQVGRWLYDD